MQSIIELINQYGYIILFCILMLELIAFPFPGEITMTYCGFMVYTGKMNWIISILAAASGAITGITISYFLGTKLEDKILNRYGSYIHLGPKQMEKVSKWFDSYGNNLILVAYFIPGVRHVTGYFSGITKISFKRFAIHAYLGAFIWAVTFISLGKVLGTQWKNLHSYADKYLVIGGTILAFILLIIYSYKYHKSKVMKNIYAAMIKSIELHHSMGRLKAFIGLGMAAFFSFIVLIAEVIQVYLANEFNKFNKVTYYVIKSTFSDEWSVLFYFFRLMTSAKVIIPLMIIISFYEITKTNHKNFNRIIEMKFLLIVVLCGQLLEYALLYVFNGHNKNIISFFVNNKNTFPDGRALMGVAAYGFLCFLIIKNREKPWEGTMILAVTMFICIGSGCSSIFLRTAHPIDVYVGYIFGGLWLSLNVILLEIVRVLNNIDNEFK